MEIKLYKNQHAKKFMKKIITSNTQLEADFYENVNRWLNEQRNVKCYVLTDKYNIKNIILLSKCDYDPQKTHSLPFILDYIYTFMENRRNNFAHKMLLYIKTKEQITAFCSNNESAKVFEKAGYIFSGYDLMIPIFRYP
jgi:hypothetical protein